MRSTAMPNPAEIEARVPHFLERAGYYFGNWDRLYDDWLIKIRALVQEMTEITVEPLPEREPIEVITGGVGVGSGFTLQESYHRLCDLALKLWQYHFEFLNLGYAAYLDLFGFCKQLFPSIPDQAIAKMVAGIQVDLFQPDDEVKKLAQLAVELGLADKFAGSSPAAEVFDELRSDLAHKQGIVTNIGGGDFHAPSSTDGLREFASSSNGDRWFLGRDGASGVAHVVHKSNVPSGGAVTHIELGAFLNRGPSAPEILGLLRMIGSLVN